SVKLPRLYWVSPSLYHSSGVFGWAEASAGTSSNANTRHVIRFIVMCLRATVRSRPSSRFHQIAVAAPGPGARAPPTRALPRIRRWRRRRPLLLRLERVLARVVLVGDDRDLEILVAREAEHDLDPLAVFGQRERLRRARLLLDAVDEDLRPRRLGGQRDRR